MALGPLGLECTGHVTRMGEGVVGFSVGDAVVAISEASLGGHAIACAELVANAPAGFNLQQLAGFPIAFLTAQRALMDVGRLQPGESVLIHSAAGGVGLAAFQIAKLAGAKIYATAGTPEKRALLASMGAAGVFDSRSPTFGDEVLAATHGHGVDVILNSLAGEAIDEGLRVLAPYGRFVEIGKRDIFANKPIGMAALSKQIVVTSVDLLSQLRDRAASTGDAMRDLLARLVRGELSLLPARMFPAEQLSETFREFLRGTHVGKVHTFTRRGRGVTVSSAPPHHCKKRCDLSDNWRDGNVGYGSSAISRETRRAKHCACRPIRTNFCGIDANRIDAR